MARFSEARLLLNGRTVGGLRNTHITIFNVNNINKCMYRTLIEDKIKGLSLVSGSGMYVDGLGHRVVTAEGAINGCGARMVGDHVLRVGPRARIGVRGYFFLPRGTRRFPFRRCSCMMSTISAMATGVTLMVGYGRVSIPVVDDVNTKGGLSTDTFHMASVCGAGIYPLTGIVQHRLGGHNMGGLGMMCSRRRPVHPVRSASSGYDARAIYRSNMRCGTTGHESAPNDITFMPSITNLVVTNRMVGSLTEWREAAKRRE